MKKKIFLLLLLFSFFISKPVEAKESYFTNKYNVSLSKSQYDFISELYWDGYQNYINLEEYNYLLNNNFFNNTIDSYEISDFNNKTIFLDTTHETKSKVLKVSKVCATNCFITVTLTWKTIPNIKSYDVIGAYLPSTNLANNQINTSVFADDKRTDYNEYQKLANGFGASVKIPNNINSSLKITQNFTVQKTGSLNVSYQHAKKAISLENSKKYSIGPSGYGGVFNFTYSSYFDAMQGVSITL